MPRPTRPLVRLALPVLGGMLLIIAALVALLTLSRAPLDADATQTALAEATFVQQTAAAIYPPTPVRQVFSLALGRSVQVIIPVYTVHIYEVAVDQPRLVEITLRDVNRPDVQLHLGVRSEDGPVLTRPYASSPDGLLTITVLMTPGTARLNLDNLTDTAIEYELTLSAGQPIESPVRPIQYGESVAGALLQANTWDEWQLEAADGDWATIVVDGPGFVVRVEVWTRGTGDDHITRATQQRDRVVLEDVQFSAGTFGIIVRGSGDSFGPYQLTLTRSAE